MAKRIAIENDDTDDGSDTGGNVESLLSKLMGGNNDDSPAKSGELSAYEMVKIEMERDKMKEERRSKSENKQLMIQLATIALPLIVGLLKKETDPLMLELIRNKTDDVATRNNFQSMMELQNSASQANLQNAIQSMTSVMGIKDKLTSDALERARNRDDDDRPAKSGIADTLREVRMIMQSMKLGEPVEDPRMAELLGEGKPEAAPIVPVAPVAPVARIPVKPTAAQVVLRSIMEIHTNKNLTVAERAQIKAGMVAAVLTDEKLTDALNDEDQETILEICQPVVAADAVLLEWMQGEGVAPFLMQYVSGQVIPMVQEALLEDDGEDDGDDAEDPEPEVLTIPEPVATKPAEKKAIQ